MTQEKALYTLIGDYSEGGYKGIDIKSKIVSLKVSWGTRLSDKNFHLWKIIPVFYKELVCLWQDIYSNNPLGSKTQQNLLRMIFHILCVLLPEYWLQSNLLVGLFHCKA